MTECDQRLCLLRCSQMLFRDCELVFACGDGRNARLHCFHRREMSAAARSEDRQRKDDILPRFHGEVCDSLRAGSGPIYRKTIPVTMRPKRIPTTRLRTLSRSVSGAYPRKTL